MKDPIEIMKNLEKDHFFLRSELLLRNYLTMTPGEPFEIADLFYAQIDRFDQLYSEELEKLNPERRVMWSEVGKKAADRYSKKIDSYYEKSLRYPFLSYLEDELDVSIMCLFGNKNPDKYYSLFSLIGTSTFEPEQVIDLLQTYWFNQPNCKTKKVITDEKQVSLFVSFNPDYCIATNDLDLIYFYPWNVQITAGPPSWSLSVHYFKNASFWEKIDELKPPEKEVVTLKEHLQLQIDSFNLWDASGKITPDTLWRFICYSEPKLKDKYELNSEYKGEEDDLLKIAIVSAVSGLAAQNAKAPLSMQKRHERHV